MAKVTSKAARRLTSRDASTPPPAIPKVGSKDWKWFRHGTIDDATHCLDTPVGIYEIKMDTAGHAEVTVVDDSMTEHEVAEFDLFRFGEYVENLGTTFTKEQEKLAFRRVKRLVELDARLSMKAAQRKAAKGK